MKATFVSSAFLALASVAPAIATTYSLADNIVGNAFYSAFDWQRISDPTNGRVYVVLFKISLNIG